MRKELRSLESNSGNGFVTLLLLLLTGMLGYLFWKKYNQRSGGQSEFDDLRNLITDLQKEILAGPRGKVVAQVPARENLAAELKARSSELEAARVQVQEMAGKLKRSSDSALELEQRHAASVSALEDSRRKTRDLLADVKKLGGDLESTHQSAAKLHEELQALRSALVPATPAGLAASLGDELVVSVKGDAPHAVSLLGCMGMIKSAECVGMDEEVLLSAVRQFSESYSAYHAEKGSSPESIQKGLVAWADALNTQFAGKIGRAHV
jgi:hypothetical protein